MVRHAPEFQAAADFQEGLARVYVWDKIVCTTAQEYNKDNAPEYLFRLPGWGGNESCFPQEARFGFIDKTGSLIVHARFTWLEDLSEGLAVAKVDAGAKFWLYRPDGNFRDQSEVQPGKFFF